MSFSKKGGFELSVRSIVILVIMIFVVFLLLNLVIALFGKTSLNFEEQISKEPEPPKPTSNNPISFSRENIKAQAGKNEIIKVSILNPTGIDWTGRDYLYHGLIYPYECGESDYVCYVSASCDGSTDPDCIGIEKTDRCKDDERCLVNEWECPEYEDVGGVDPVVPEKKEEVRKEFDPGLGPSDCGPREGIDLLVRCDNELEINKLSNPKKIGAGRIGTFNLVLNIKKGLKGSYLCKIHVFGNNANHELIKGVEKDLAIDVS